jgi:hypothetical protein
MHARPPSAQAGRVRVAGPDGLKLLAGLRSSVDHAFERAAGPAIPVSAQRELLLTLELHNKLLEQLLLPDLSDTGRVARERIARAQKGIECLRDLAQQLRDAPPSGREAADTLAAMEAVAMLHYDEVDALLARDPSAVDRGDLGRRVQAMLQRWKRELRDTGDIEDEEADPVGRPPR